MISILQEEEVKSRGSLYRTVEILKRLNELKRLSVSALAMEYGVSERTIRRDFELIRDIFGDFIVKDGEFYRAYDKFLLDGVLHSSDLMTLANIVNLFTTLQKQTLIASDTKELIKHSMSIYDFKSRPFENIENLDTIKKLEHAIKFQKEIEIKYTIERFTSYSIFWAYKITFLNENFYLVGVNATKDKVEYRRVSMIDEVKYTKKSFFKNRDVEQFLDSIQTPWARYGRDTLLVKIRVDVSVRRFFIKKKYLPSQEISHTFDNGDVEVTYRVSSYKEVEELIIKWLPHVRVISPRRLNKSIKKSLNKKLNALF
jgi:predicted DNA-binding transcriptional regulator YafY